MHLIEKTLSPAVHNLVVNYRTHSGKHLIKRGVRRVMNKAAPSIFDGLIRIVTYNNKMVITFSNKVKPSVNQILH